MNSNNNRDGFGRNARGQGAQGNRLMAGQTLQYGTVCFFALGGWGMIKPDKGGALVRFLLGKEDTRFNAGPFMFGVGSDDVFFDLDAQSEYRVGNGAKVAYVVDSSTGLCLAMGYQAAYERAMMAVTERPVYRIVARNYYAGRANDKPVTVSKTYTLEEILEIAPKRAFEVPSSSDVFAPLYVSGLAVAKQHFERRLPNGNWVACQDPRPIEFGGAQFALIEWLEGDKGAGVIVHEGNLPSLAARFPRHKDEAKDNALRPSRPKALRFFARVEREDVLAEIAEVPMLAGASRYTQIDDPRPVHLTLNELLGIAGQLQGGVVHAGGAISENKPTVAPVPTLATAVAKLGQRTSKKQKQRQDVAVEATNIGDLVETAFAEAGRNGSRNGKLRVRAGTRRDSVTA